ncbi:MAG: hypothetical protein WCB68_17435 [Pyrinomonadaceae bacterium]
MKIFFLFLLLTCALPLSVHSSQDKGLHVSLSSVRREHSRDSGSTTITINVDNQTLTYDETRTGMRRGEPVHKKYLLTDEEVLKLKRFVREKKLLVNGSSEYPAGNPPFIFYTLNAQVRLDGKQAQIKASGPSSALRNDKFYKQANALFEELMSIIYAHDQPAPK